MQRNPIRSVRTLAVVLSWSAVLALADTPSKGRPQASPPAETLATVGDVTITAAQVEVATRERLARLRAEEYAIKRAALDELVMQALLKKEAAARGVSVEALVRENIDAKLLPATDEQARAVYQSHPDLYRGKAEGEALAQIKANLARLRERDARTRFLAQLREKVHVRTYLEPPRVTLDASKGAAKGPASAPVTLVEFSDFQCPYCARVTPTLAKLQETYGERLRIVFRHFPLAMHAQAAQAAEAAECAGEQGKFWQMHDALFAGQRSLQVPDLKRRAVELELDAERFNQCLDSGRSASRWQQDMAEGQRHGVRGTPTFFVNGRLLTGGMTAQGFTELIDEELARLGPTGAASAAAGR